MGKLVDVAAKTDIKDKDGKVSTKNGTVQYDFGDNLDEAVKKFSADVVYSAFVAQATINLQAGMRRILLADGDLVAFAKSWKPGVAAPRVAVDPIAAAKTKYAQMSKEERAKFLESLRAMG